MATDSGLNKDESVTPGTFRDVFQLLNQYNVRYVVVGGLAVLLHGYNRRVLDLDIVIPSEPSEQHRAQQVLMMAGFMPTIPLPLNMLTVLRMLDQFQREIDVFIRFQVSFEDLWADRAEFYVEGVPIPVTSIEHLVQAKRATGRPEDLRDAELILAVANQPIDNT
jgi:hypothetical protein